MRFHSLAGIRGLAASSWVAAVVLLASAFSAGMLQAQSGPLAKSLEAAGGGEKRAASEKTEGAADKRARLDTWLREAREALARLEAQDAAASLPEGITAGELDERRRDLEQIIPTITRAIKSLRVVEDSRKTLESARAAEASWKGFKEEPPFSLLMIDDLLNERDAILAKLKSQKSALSNFEHLMMSTVAGAKATEDLLNNRIAALQTAGEKEQPAARWRVEAARAKTRLQAVRAGSLTAAIDATKELIVAAESELSLVDRKVATARVSTRFDDQDMARVRELSSGRVKVLRKEIDDQSKRLNQAISARTKAKAALDALSAETGVEANPDELDLAQFRLEVAEGRVDAIQWLIEGLENLVQLENLMVESYQTRRALIEAVDADARAKALTELTETLARVRAWENVVRNEISGADAELEKLESRGASMAPDDPRAVLLADQRASAGEKLDMARRMLGTTVAQRKLLRRWEIEYSPADEDLGFFERIGKVSAAVADRVERIWSFQVMSFEEKVEVDGQTITGRIPVTLGLLLRALLFFLIGYWIIARITTRIQRVLVGRGHIAEAQARTLRNWAMIVAGFFLAIGTLSFLKIPLTVFAFFGGALAIGLGFGTQTLIKNFISGIIVLAERKVRVGDVLDVGGVVGTVVEVNTRSSVIRGADDVETMIPNSLFLENQVTNLTLSSSKVRRCLRVSASYGTLPQTVISVLVEAANRHGVVCKDPQPFAVFEDFGDSALIFALYFWVELGGGHNWVVVASDLRIMIEKRFRELEIGVPFPQRDMHLTTTEPLEVRLNYGDNGGSGSPKSGQ